MSATSNSLISFLKEKGWRQGETGKYNIGYIPPVDLELPNSYRLQIPIDANADAFEIYSKQVEEILLEFYKKSEIQKLFSSSASVLAMRIIDNDTKNGTINLERLTSTLEHLKNIIRDAATFSANRLQIFNKTTQEAKQYIKMCRGLQTEVGSYVTKIQLPSQSEMVYIMHNINTNDVVNQISNTIDFISNDVPTISLSDIDSLFIEQNKNLVSIELMSQIKNLFSAPKTNHAEFYLTSQDASFNIESNDMSKKMPHIVKFIKKSREVLLKHFPLTVRGRITKLTSKNVFGLTHQIEIETEIEGKKQNVKVNLRRDNYEQAIEAHKANRQVQTTGMATHISSYYVIEDALEFLSI